METIAAAVLSPVLRTVILHPTGMPFGLDLSRDR
jgi:hypothetical protein